METDKWQWQMWVTVRHGPAFGHRLEMGLNSPQWAAPLITSLGAWKGLGIPESVLNQARARIDAVLTDHLVTRYGVQGELPHTWAGESEPF